MVARSEDKPRTVTDRIDNAARRLDELARAQANGSPTLYNEAGHLLTLDAQSATPFLVPRNTDSALRFNNGRLEVTDPTGGDLRDITARRFISDDVSFEVRGGTAYIAGPTGVGWRTLQTGTAYIHGTLYTDNDFRPGGTTYSAGDINAPKFRGNLGGPNDGYTTYGNHQGDVGGGQTVGASVLVYGGRVEDAQGNVRVAPACERRLKHHVRDLHDPLSVVERWRPAVATWADETTRALRGDDPFAAVYVDEVAETAPEVVYDRGDGTRTTDDRGLIAYLTASVQQLAAQNRDLLARVAALEGRESP